MSGLTPVCEPSSREPSASLCRVPHVAGKVKVVIMTHFQIHNHKSLETGAPLGESREGPAPLHCDAILAVRHSLSPPTPHTLTSGSTLPELLA